MAETASGDECEHRQHAYKPSDGKHKYKQKLTAQQSQIKTFHTATEPEGTLLHRKSHSERKYDVSQLCKLMSCPSNAAFDTAMRMVAYTEQHKSKGILFSADGNVRPVIVSDASNKQDPHNGLAQARHTAHWANGSVSSKSSLLKHEGVGGT